MIEEKVSSPTLDDTPAELIGYANPLGFCPAFVTPVFDRSGTHVIQIAGADGRIEAFGAYDEDSLGPIKPFLQKVSVRRGDLALHGFIFAPETVVITTKNELMKKLAVEKPRLARHHFLYLDVLEYLGKYDEIDPALSKIQSIYRQNPAISQDLVALERRSLYQKKRPDAGEQPILRFIDAEGFLNFWDLNEEVQHLIRLYGQAHIRFKLLRSHAGQSPKMRKMLTGLGLYPRKINSESRLVTVDRKSWPKLKVLSTMSMICEVQAYGQQEVSIKPLDPVAIRKRYFKKDPRKIVKGSHNRDYLCTLRDQRSCFISFSAKDYPFARQLRSRLQRENIKVWYSPKELKSGGKVSEDLARAIHSYNAFIMVLSETSLQSEWLHKEIRETKEVEKAEHTRKLFAITLVNFDRIKGSFDEAIKKELASNLPEHYMADFSNWRIRKNFEKGFTKLLRDLRAAD